MVKKSYLEVSNFVKKLGVGTVVGLLFLSIVPIRTVNAAPDDCQCTQYVRNMFNLTGSSGDAYSWNDGFLQSNGYTQTSPMPGTIVVMEKSYPSGNRVSGHVGVLLSINANGKITVRGANQIVGGTPYSQAGCPNVRDTLFGTSITGRTDVTFWTKTPQYSVILSDFNTANDGADDLFFLARNNLGTSKVGLAKTNTTGFSLWNTTLPAGMDESNGGYKYHFADLNGDGTSDLIRIATGSKDMWTALANPANGQFNIWSQYLPAGENNGSFNFQFSDINGDNRADMIMIARNSQDMWTALADANGQLIMWKQYIPAGENGGSFSFQFADLNGDKKSDMIMIAKRSQDMWTALADANGNLQMWKQYLNAGENNNSFRFEFADLNNDKRADMIMIAKNSQDMWTALADTTGQLVMWNQYINEGGSGSEFYFKDMNNDGAADLVRFSMTSQDSWIGLANKKTGKIHKWDLHTPVGIANGLNKFYLNDVTGDGWRDIVMYRPATYELWILKNLKGTTLSFEGWGNTYQKLY